MKNFYKILYSDDYEEIGYAHQLDQLLPNGNWKYWGEKSYINFPIIGKVNFSLEFPLFKLNNKSKIVDLLRAPNTGYQSLVVSNKLYETITAFSVDETQSFNITILMKDEKINYNMIFFSRPRDEEFVSFEKSTFRITPTLGEYDMDKEINVKNYSQYLHLKEILEDEKPSKQIRLNTLILNSENINFDVFRLQWISPGIYISERMKLAMEKQGITGIRFLPTHELRESHTTPI